MRKSRGTTSNEIFGRRARALRSLAGLLLIGGLLTTWVVTTSAKAGATGGLPGSSLLSSVSCTSASNCIVLGASGQEWTFSGSTWSPATPVDSTGSLSSVSCVGRDVLRRGRLCRAGDHLRRHNVVGTQARGPHGVTQLGLVRQCDVLRRRRLLRAGSDLRRHNVVGTQARGPHGVAQLGLVRRPRRSAPPSTIQGKRSSSTAPPGRRPIWPIRTPSCLRCRARPMRSAWPWTSRAISSATTAWGGPRRHRSTRLAS